MTDAPKKGLGRGLEALLSSDFDKQLVLDEHERIQKLAISSVVPNVDQPRRHFDQDSLEELAASIKVYGIVLPLVVTPRGKHYEIVAGERRWRAAQQAGLAEVPVVIRSMKALEQLEIALIENVQRVDLSPLEQAQTLSRLHEQFSIPYDDIAKRVGKAKSTVHNIVRLLGLPDEARDALAAHQITEGHARAILALKDDPKQQLDLLRTIILHGWSVRQAERYVTSHKEGIKDTEGATARVATETPATKALSKRLGTAVQVKRMAKGGRLEIRFKSDEELEAIIKRVL